MADGELSFAADDDMVAALTVSLGQARVGITRLVEQSATLEELFLELTEPGERIEAAA